MKTIKNITTVLPDECMIVNWDMGYEFEKGEWDKETYRIDSVVKVNQVKQTQFGKTWMDITELVNTSMLLAPMLHFALLNYADTKELSEIGGDWLDEVVPPVKITLHEVMKAAI